MSARKQDAASVAALANFVPGGWEGIQAAQQGRPIRLAPIDLSKPGKRPATDADRAALAAHGASGLRERRLFGILDRLNLPFTD